MDGLKISTTEGFINAADNLSKASGSQSLIKSKDQGGPSFADTLQNAVNSVDQLQKVSDKKMQELAAGKNNNLHETMIAAEKADIALKLMVQMRNKMIDAYQEIIRMQV